MISSSDVAAHDPDNSGMRGLPILVLLLTVGFLAMPWLLAEEECTLWSGSGRIAEPGHTLEPVMLPPPVCRTLPVTPEPFPAWAMASLGSLALTLGALRLVLEDTKAGAELPFMAAVGLALLAFWATLAVVLGEAGAAGAVAT